MKNLLKQSHMAVRRKIGRKILSAVSWSTIAIVTILLSTSVAEQPMPSTESLRAKMPFANTTTITADDATVHTTPITTTTHVSESSRIETRSETTIASSKPTEERSRPSQPATTSAQPATTSAQPPVPVVKVDPRLSKTKLVALTFDDGPHKTLTPRLLDILKKEQVTATFFVVGSRAKQHPNIVKRAAQEGHQIGNHTYSHKKLPSLSKAARQRDLNASADVIEQMTGKRPTVMRPPYGSYNRTVASEAEAAVVLWSIDPQDWRYRNAATVFRNATRNVKDGDIILLHDIHSQTINAVEPILSKLKSEGFTFVTVEQLIAARSSLRYGKVYTACRK